MEMLSQLKRVIGVALLWAYCQVAAAEISRPSFVDNVGKESLEAAGSEVYAWIAVGFAVLLGLASLWPALLFVQGRKEEGWDAAKNVLIGAVGFVALGALAFGVLEAMG
jgi:drug/metabolite transporter (DMT)-like permease